MHHSKAIMHKHMSFGLSLEHTCHATMSCSSQGVEGWRHKQTHYTLETPLNSNATRLQTAPSLLRLFQSCCQAGMINPSSFACTGLSEINCAPFSLNCHICSPFSLWIFKLQFHEGEMVQIVSCKGDNNIYMAGTITYVINNPFMCRRTSFLYCESSY